MLAVADPRQTADQVRLGYAPAVVDPSPGWQMEKCWPGGFDAADGTTKPSFRTLHFGG